MSEASGGSSFWALLEADGVSEIQHAIRIGSRLFAFRLRFLAGQISHSPQTTHFLSGLAKEKSKLSVCRQHGLPKQFNVHELSSNIKTRTPAPNPQSQSFSRSYGSVLPTSLTYFVLSTRGYKPWRPDAVMGTTRGVNKSVLRLFKGS